MLGQPLFPCTGTLDRMPSRLVHPYPTLRFTRNNPFVLSISGSRYSRKQERPICCRLVPYLHASHFRSGTSLSLSLSLSVSFSAIRLHSLYFFLMFAFLFFSYCFIGLGYYLGSVSCARPDSFVMHSASSGTPGSHTPAGNFRG